MAESESTPYLAIYLYTFLWHNKFIREEKIKYPCISTAFHCFGDTYLWKLQVAIIYSPDLFVLSFFFIKTKMKLELIFGGTFILKAGSFYIFPSWSLYSLLGKKYKNSKLKYFHLWPIFILQEDCHCTIAWKWNLNCACTIKWTSMHPIHTHWNCTLDIYFSCVCMYVNTHLYRQWFLLG